jgi:hypothetical protein
MSERGQQLQATADRQIAELIDLVATLDHATVRLPCPGRDKLGDGTVAASAQHMADNYQRIVAFVQTSNQKSGPQRPTQPDGHRMPRFLQGLGHRPPDHAKHEPGARHDDDRYTADRISPGELVDQLSASREALGQIATFTDTQLETVPPDGSFRFCDGQRTLDQVLASLLKHQDHQVRAVKQALA